MNMTLGNKLFKKKARHHFTYEFDPLKSWVDFCLVRRNQTKLLKDVKSLCVTPNINHWYVILR